MDLKRIRTCSFLLEPPASQVVGELIDEIERVAKERDELRAEVERLKVLCRKAGEMINDFQHGEMCDFGDTCRACLLVYRINEEVGE